jgi:hypothetical protein
MNCFRFCSGIVDLTIHSLHISKPENLAKDEDGVPWPKEKFTMPPETLVPVGKKKFFSILHTHSQGRNAYCHMQLQPQLVRKRFSIVLWPWERFTMPPEAVGSPSR